MTFFLRKLEKQQKKKNFFFKERDPKSSIFIFMQAGNVLNCHLLKATYYIFVMLLSTSCLQWLTLMLMER